MPFNINTFRSELSRGGARTSLFEVILTNPVNSNGDTKFPFMCRAAALPASSINPIEQFYFGRPVKFAGNRTFDPWNVTIINDEDYLIRNALEEWSNGINKMEGNIRGLPTSSPAEYKATAEVRHYSQKGDVLRTYKFIGLWPQVIGEIQMDWQTDTITEFPVQFSLDYFFVSDQATGDAGGK